LSYNNTTAINVIKDNYQNALHHFMHGRMEIKIKNKNEMKCEVGAIYEK
jgi:hypothetical protein